MITQADVQSLAFPAESYVAVVTTGCAIMDIAPVNRMETDPGCGVRIEQVFEVRAYPHLLNSN
jgi:hypothetical protein